MRAERPIFGFGGKKGILGKLAFGKTIWGRWHSRETVFWKADILGIHRAGEMVLGRETCSESGSLALRDL